MKKYDAILIPGGGVRKGGLLPEWTKARLDTAFKMWRGEYFITLSAGTTHKPPVLDKDGFSIFESVAAADYLIKKGVDKKMILAETSSYDTIGNAYFSRMIHCEPRKFRRLLVISSSFHMPRVKEIFKWIYGLSKPKNPYRLNFKKSPNKGLKDELLKLKIKKEKNGLKNLAVTRKKINTLEKLHKWLYTEHAACVVGLKPKKIRGKLLKTY